jgi:uncharacterized protein YeaO (DUF488 family)
MSIRTKRVYEAPTPEDGSRFLVDRLWSRGLKKDALPLDGWLKDAAPSDALRRWFQHDPVKWPEFRRRYIAELDRHPEPVQTLLNSAARGPVTLLFGASDITHNNAVVLKEYLEARLKIAKDSETTQR